MSSSPKASRRQRLTISLICVVSGLYLVSIAVGLLPAGKGDANAPSWILALCGVAFVIAGFMAFVGRQARANELLAAILLLIFGAVGLWVSLFSSSNGFSGGIPFMPDDFNVRLARVLFGFGSLISFALSAWAFKRFLRYTQ